ncbi:Maternal effect protein oskar [Frankliniella fusca]|uniref:Maternal effect protein oskar n=1 Tax=Frankliniella fusca TaxID=407009 RepID=A0AAE1HR69_9NEOP|nr:Maternal effect protein oskar [Frankliniella fusca]
MPRKRKSEAVKAAAAAEAAKRGAERRRARETEEEASERRALSTAEMRDRRARLAEEEAAAARGEAHGGRLGETDDATASRREAHAAEMRDRRARETPEEVQERRAADAERHALVRGLQDPEAGPDWPGPPGHASGRGPAPAGAPVAGPAKRGPGLGPDWDLLQSSVAPGSPRAAPCTLGPAAEQCCLRAAPVLRRVLWDLLQGSVAFLKPSLDNNSTVSSGCVSTFLLSGVLNKEMSGDKAIVMALPVEDAVKVLIGETRSRWQPGPQQRNGGWGSCSNGGRDPKGGRVQKKRGKGPHRKVQRVLHQKKQQLLEQQKQQRHQQQGHEVVSAQTPALWNGFEMIGDSIMIRLYKEVLPLAPQAVFDKNLKRKCLGSMVSGQTICQLSRLMNGKEKHHNQCIIMIGTNDILNGTPLDKSTSGLKSIRLLLEKHKVDAIFCTIPPIPKKRTDCELFNIMLRGVVGDMATIIDVNKLFLKDDGTIKLNLFHMKHPSGERDEVHPNQTGLRLMRELIEPLLLPADNVMAEDK